MSGQIVVQRVGRGSSGGTCEVAPATPGLPVMRTGKVCELLPRPTQSIIQQMEHINWKERGRERESPPEVGAGRWVAGVGEHLTQTLFVLWAGVHITVKVYVLGGGGTKVSELGYEDKKETSLFPLRNGNCPSLISILKQIIIYLLI